VIGSPCTRSQEPSIMMARFSSYDRGYVLQVRYSSCVQEKTFAS
jgi:hypothetical protein